MPSKVYWGSPRQTQIGHEETLPAKLDLIIEKLNLRERVKDQRVAIKMHLGGNVGYSMVHPVFVRKVVTAVKEGGGHPFVTDHAWSVATAHERGYTAETLGCPLYPSIGMDEKWFITKPYEFMNMKEFNIGGPIAEASFMVNLAHAKGHPATAFGAALKNIALGCVNQATRSAMHDVSHYKPYVFKDRLRDEAHRQAIRDACPYGAIVDDLEDPGGLHLHHYKCNECLRCQPVAEGAFEIQPEAFVAFLKVMNISAKLTLDTFEPGNITNLTIATHMTPLCDCFGFTGMPVLPDAGVFGSDDIVAIDQALLDVTGQTPIIEENLPGMMEIIRREGHPFTWIHGPSKDPYIQTAHAAELGLGSCDYELIDVLPMTEPDFKQDTYVPAVQ